MEYEAPRVEQRTEVSAPLNTFRPSQTVTNISPRWRTGDAEED